MLRSPCRGPSFIKLSSTERISRRIISTLSKYILPLLSPYLTFYQMPSPSTNQSSRHLLLTTMSLVAYRHLLRSTRIAFQGPFPHPPSLIPPLDLPPRFLSSILTPTGDLPLLKAARQEARNGFLAQASLRPEDPALGLAIAHAEQVSKILVENIVQGKNQGGDKYSESYISISTSTSLSMK